MNAAKLLTTAAEIVEGSRQQTHGKKERSFETIAAFWNVYMRRRDITRMRLLEGSDVAAMMMLLKLARAIEGEPNADHWVDMAGYAGLMGELATGSADHTESAEGD